MSDLAWLVGIDDTDNPDTIGTGRLARMLAEHLVAEGRLADPAVTRHQFLVHPDIPYTSHNSSACIAARGPADRDGLGRAARRFLEAHFHEGANPGLCICARDRVPEALVVLGKRAQREVLALAEFDAVAAETDVFLWSAGETGQGRIGATSGVALRSAGEDGRFIGLRGIRDLTGVVTVAEVLARSGVVAVQTTEGDRLGPDVAIDTRDWVRPSLRAGVPVLVVRREEARWVPAERRSKDD